MSKEDGSKAQTSEENAEVFRVHFEKLYSRTPVFDPTSIDCLDQREIVFEIGNAPDIDEIKTAIHRLKTNPLVKVALPHKCLNHSSMIMIP